MMIFSEDTDVARLIPARIDSYSVSLLDMGSPVVWPILFFPQQGL